nr:hypothetical protein 1 [Bacillaceae bacterium]
MPIGVYYHKNYEKYMARCNDKNGKNINIDCYDVPEDAFISYKAFKENVIKEIAEEHWGEIPLRLYEALMKYEVEITD